jgi:N-methylhydantoinase A
VAVLGIDVGGTFTDAVLVSDGRLVTAKVPTAARQEEAVVAAARAVGAGEAERFAHGTTIATPVRRPSRTARCARALPRGGRADRP